jgi:hypothetical protein
MIKRSALPKGIVTKVIGDTKLVRTLAGHLKMQEVIMMPDLRLPQFDKKTGASTNKKFYCLTMIMSNTTSSWVQTFFSRLE